MTRMANHSAVNNLAIASLDTYRVLERISVAVRSLHLSRTGPSHSIFFSFPAQGQKCWRDSYNKTQCGEPPCDGIPGYEPCPGEDFCCRASTLVKLSWYELLNFLLFQRRDSSAGATLTTRLNAAINLVIASLDMSPALEKISVAVSLPSLCCAGPSRSTLLTSQRRDRNVGAILTTRPSAASHLVMANPDTNRALEKISVAVRSLQLFWTGSSHSFFSFPAQGQQCWRDSYNKTQCGNKPCDCDPGYEPCPGEDFCCRESTLF